ncbi:glycosyl hydrolase [Algoriphagus halophilus]|uniref:glycosyl hydrolase n=1 Tax=Algoriphagus halophilus TaxID=226505 RepID=UPI00358E8DFE
MDHFSKAAVDSYNRYFETALSGKDYGFRAFYNDSFEVYGADFTAGFFEEFEKLRGYDLKEYLPYLEMEEGSEIVRRVKSDYRETINDLLLGNFTKNWTTWAHTQGKITKNQAHGSPGNLLDLYAAVDIPECETFGSSYFPIPGLRRDSADIRNVDPDPIMLKFASSAAHITGKNLVSSETFTWLGEHFKSSFSQMKPEVEQAFLAGVNHIFYHGVTYSPDDVSYPGWLFMLP